jgi:hypothetical protein
MIQSHLYARFNGTPVFSIPAAQGEPVCLLKKGDWMGVIVQQGDWIHVVGIACEGWVMAGDTEYRPPFQLHIRCREGEQISYVNDPGIELAK